MSDAMTTVHGTSGSIGTPGKRPLAAIGRWLCLFILVSHSASSLSPSMGHGKVEMNLDESDDDRAARRRWRELKEEYPSNDVGNNTGMLVKFSPFALRLSPVYLPSNADNLDSEMEGLRWSLEYHLNETLADLGLSFDDGTRFEFSKVYGATFISANSQQNEPMRRRRRRSMQLATPEENVSRQLKSPSITVLVDGGEAFYSYGPGGLFFSSIPSRSQLEHLVISGVEQHDDGGHTGGALAEKLRLWSSSQFNSNIYETLMTVKKVDKLPTSSPTAGPSKAPTPPPSKMPTQSPSLLPTSGPTNEPTIAPSQNPTRSPTIEPTDSPSKSPTLLPTTQPTDRPSDNPTSSPTLPPSNHPTDSPSLSPIASLVWTTGPPVASSTASPAKSPVNSPVKSTAAPTLSPIVTIPTVLPTVAEDTESPTEILITPSPTESPSTLPSSRYFASEISTPYPTQPAAAPLPDAIATPNPTTPLAAPPSFTYAPSGTDASSSLPPTAMTISPNEPSHAPSIATVNVPTKPSSNLLPSADAHQQNSLMTNQVLGSKPGDSKNNGRNIILASSLAALSTLMIGAALYARVRRRILLENIKAAPDLCLASTGEVSSQDGDLESQTSFDPIHEEILHPRINKEDNPRYDFNEDYNTIPESANRIPHENIDSYYIPGSAHPENTIAMPNNLSPSSFDQPPHVDFVPKDESTILETTGETCDMSAYEGSPGQNDATGNTYTNREYTSSDIASSLFLQRRHGEFVGGSETLETASETFGTNDYEESSSCYPADLHGEDAVACTNSQYTIAPNPPPSSFLQRRYGECASICESETLETTGETYGTSEYEDSSSEFMNFKPSDDWDPTCSSSKSYQGGQNSSMPFHSFSPNPSNTIPPTTDDSFGCKITRPWKGQWRTPYGNQTVNQISPVMTEPSLSEYEPDVNWDFGDTEKDGSLSSEDAFITPRSRVSSTEHFQW